MKCYKGSHVQDVYQLTTTTNLPENNIKSENFNDNDAELDLKKFCKKIFSSNSASKCKITPDNVNVQRKSVEIHGSEDYKINIPEDVKLNRVSSLDIFLDALLFTGVIFAFIGLVYLNYVANIKFKWL